MSDKNIGEFLKNIDVCKSFEEKINESMIFVLGIMTHHKHLQTEIDRCDMAIRDLQHDIELSRLSGAEMMKDTKEMKLWLVRRRIYLKMMSICNKVSYNDFVTAVKRSNCNANKTYSPKIIKQLKCGEKS